jgi:hypothetical protein
MSLATISEQSPPASSLTNPLRWAALGAAILLLAGLQTTLINKPGELPVYLKAADRMLAGDAIYRTDDGPAFSYPPFFALPFVPLSGLPRGAVDFVWNAANLAQACGVVAMLLAIGRRLQGGAAYRFEWWQVLAVILSARLFVSPLEYRSHDYLVALMLLGALLASLRRQELLVGLLLGLATACKATPLVFLPMLMVQRRFTAAGTMIAACLLATLLPDLLFPADSGRLWVDQWNQVFISKVEVSGPAAASGAWRAWNPLNQSLSGTLYRLTTPPETPEFADYNLAIPGVPAWLRKIVTLSSLGGIYLASLTACWWSGRGRPALRSTAWSDSAVWSLLIAEMLLLSPMTSKTHFAPLVLAVVLASIAAFDRPRRDWFLLALLGLLFLVGTCLAKDLVGRRLGTYALVAGSLTWCALLCWIASLYMIVRGPRDDAAAQTAAAASN